MASKLHSWNYALLESVVNIVLALATKVRAEKLDVKLICPWRIVASLYGSKHEPHVLVSGNATSSAWTRLISNRGKGEKLPFGKVFTSAGRTSARGRTEAVKKLLKLCEEDMKAVPVTVSSPRTSNVCVCSRRRKPDGELIPQKFVPQEVVDAAVAHATKIVPKFVRLVFYVQPRDNNGFKFDYTVYVLVDVGPDRDYVRKAFFRVRYAGDKSGMDDYDKSMAEMTKSRAERELAEANEKIAAANAKVGVAEQEWSTVALSALPHITMAWAMNTMKLKAPTATNVQFQVSQRPDSPFRHEYRMILEDASGNQLPPITFEDVNDTRYTDDAYNNELYAGAGSVTQSLSGRLTSAVVNLVNFEAKHGRLGKMLVDLAKRTARIEAVLEAQSKPDDTAARAMVREEFIACIKKVFGDFDTSVLTPQQPEPATEVAVPDNGTAAG